MHWSIDSAQCSDSRSCGSYTNQTTEPPARLDSDRIAFWATLDIRQSVQAALEQPCDPSVTTSFWQPLVCLPCYPQQWRKLSVQTTVLYVIHGFHSVRPSASAGKHTSLYAQQAMALKGVPTSFAGVRRRSFRNHLFRVSAIADVSGLTGLAAGTTVTSSTHGLLVGTRSDPAPAAADERSSPSFCACLVQS